MSEFKFAVSIRKNKNESCPICLTKFKTSHYQEYDDEFLKPYKGKFTESELAKPMRHFDDEAKDPCWHHLCECCWFKLFDNALDDMADEEVSVKCPVCRRKYVVSNDVLKSHCDDMGNVTEDDAEPVAAVEPVAVVEPVAAVEPIFSMDDAINRMMQMPVGGGRVLNMQM